MSVRRIDHVAIAVDSLPDAVRLFHDVLGATFVTGGDDPDYDMRVVHLAIPPLKLELLQPLNERSGMNQFLRERGQGFHHLTMIVDDVLATERAVVEGGFETVGTNLSDPGWHETYIRPTSGFGTLLQLAATPKEWKDPDPEITLQDVLAGRVVWSGSSDPRLKAAGE